MKKLFGTDGIRAKAGEYPLDKDTVKKIGRAVALRIGGADGSGGRFITGRDTRESGPWIESAVHAGIRSAGGEPVSAGVVSTPGVAFIAAEGGFDAGIVISASHNPYADNGIKVFMPDGKKLDRESEEFIESELEKDTDIPDGEASLDESGAAALQSKYVQHFGVDFGLLDLEGVKIVADCANGAASELAPMLFRRFGADLEAINADPDGRNINRDCGSLHLDPLREAVLKKGADIGVAFDGDADRSLFIGDNGEIVDGDAVLWIMANLLKKRGKLKGDKVVATVMSNVGLEIALEGIGVELVRTDVGDKYVLEELLRSGASVGGEQSGHIIFPSRSLVGDGLQTALYVLDAMVSEGDSLSGLTRGFVTYPQTLVNVRVEEKVPFEEIEGLSDIVKETEAELEGAGRLLLRYSGTEKLARVMIEGRDQPHIERLAGRIAETIRDAIGEAG